jgi:hypothetical protein
MLTEDELNKMNILMGDEKMTKQNYTLKNGKSITVGTQNFINGTIPVIINGNMKMNHTMVQDSNGDLGFWCDGEFVYFRDLSSQ